VSAPQAVAPSVGVASPVDASSTGVFESVVEMLASSVVDVVESDDEPHPTARRNRVPSNAFRVMFLLPPRADDEFDRSV
jgi:hypothetical protein